MTTQTRQPVMGGNQRSALIAPQNSGESCPSDLCTGVTARNYAAKAKAFMEIHGNTRTVICQRQSTYRDEEGNPFVVNLRAWGAWLAYYKRIGYNTALMMTRDIRTVPAPWPHLFDA